MAQDVKSQKHLEKLMVRKEATEHQRPVLYFKYMTDALHGITCMPHWFSIAASKRAARA